ncbi:MAG: TonB-dependent receptor plug domain-containing protein, partial [Steroidobacteraceae bacterium]|nr:TonB-dependent receptor plug domain-containing protein [Steroidobacteraceae bacterium]
QALEQKLEEVVVTSTRVATNLAGVTEQTAPKSRISITNEYLQTQLAGQTIFQSINLIPGVNFTNNDPYGSSGGNLRIRSFDGSRVSVTFDGIPLNDSGNYALFTNQMLDPELVERVDVNLGTTDVDSPTASATGGTVAYRSRAPLAETGGEFALSIGEHSFRRAFGRFDTGEFGPWATRAWLAASITNYDKFKGPGELDKKQINAKLEQRFDSGNWFSVALHYNQNRNNFYRTSSDANFRQFGREYDNTPFCTRDLPTPGVADNDGAQPIGNTVVNGVVTLLATDNPANPSACTNYFRLRINPSNTGNIRAQSLWNLSDRVKLTFDPSIQYVLANGGGTTLLPETPPAGTA